MTLSGSNELVVTSIVPRLPPIIDGVGDYAFHLARGLHRDFGIKTDFIVGDSRRVTSVYENDFPVSVLEEHSSDALFSILANKNIILLHFVNYGYQKRGCPLWLVDGLQSWKKNKSARRLVTMFHELYAFGPPWRRSFWLSPIQRRLTARLCRLSDVGITSMTMYANKLSLWSVKEQSKIPALPVFSSVGEPKSMRPLYKRSRRMVIFGGRASRLRIYREKFDLLRTACRLLEIEEIYDIGPAIDIGLPQITGVRLIEIGPKLAEEVNALLLDSLYGFIDYSPGYLAKSSIFAAYCAHGVIPVCTSYNPSGTDGINKDEHYLVVDRLLKGLKLNNLQVISNNVYKWYQEHNLTKQTEVFASALIGAQREL